MKKSEDKDNPGVKIPPPIVFLGFGLTGIGMEYVIPLTLPGPSWMSYIGIGIILTSFFGFGYMMSFFKKHETEIQPTKTTSKIITSGPFSFSRNPLYLIACGGLIGLGIAFNTYWALFAFIPALIIVYYTAVQKEEQYLEAKFGQEYLDYKAKVRRWL